MALIHQVSMSHERCDLILGALHDVLDATEEGARRDALNDAADQLLGAFDADHRVPEVTLPMSLATSMWTLLQEAAGLLDPHDPNPGDGEYRRGMVELICRSMGLTTDDYRDAVEAEITRRIR